MSKVTSPILTDETGKEANEFFAQMAESLKVIAKGGYADSGEAMDAEFGALLDDTNTSALFARWWPLTASSGQSKWERLERWFQLLAAGDDRVMTVRFFDPSVSGDPAGTYLDALADRQPCALATDTDDPGTDWGDEDRAFWYIRANALPLEDGTMDVLYIEGEGGFDLTGEIAPVYTFAPALWYKEYGDGQYLYLSCRANPVMGFWPLAESVAPDGGKRAMTWHPTFGGGLTEEGKLTSGAGRAPYIFASANDGNTATKKWGVTGGLWCDCDTEYILKQWQLRHCNLENSNILEGCTNYYYQYKAARAEDGVRRVLLTAAQAANLVVGSTVVIGSMTKDGVVQTNTDRGQAWLRDLVSSATITSIETVTIEETAYSAVNLALDADIDVPETAYLSTMPWISGSTEAVPGHRDGCVGNLTNGKYPMRVAGLEMLNGAYVNGLDPLYNVTKNEDGTTFDYAIFQCRDHANLSGSITSNYEDTGFGLVGKKSGWDYIKALLRNKIGIVIPSLLGGGSTTYFKSSFYGADSTGVRCPWRFGSLYSGAIAGLGCGLGGGAPSYSSWGGSPRLAGAGRKRGEWAA